MSQAIGPFFFFFFFFFFTRNSYTPTANGAEKFISKYGAHNGYVIQSPLTRQLIHDLWMSVDVFDIVFIADLEGWMGELLPHEMEEVRGRGRGKKGGK